MLGGGMPDGFPRTQDEIVELIPALRVYARNLMRGGSEADDLVQETLVKALANVERFTPGTNLRAWLFTIMRNAFLTRCVKASREKVGSDACVSGTITCFPSHDERIAGQRVLQAIDRLPDQYREAVVLVFLLGESYLDVARVCDCAIGTVKSRINRARQLIMKDLGIFEVKDLLASNY